MVEFVKKNAKQPSAAVSSKLEMVKRLPRLHENFLYQVFRFGATADHPRGDAKDVVEKGQCFAFVSLRLVVAINAYKRRKE